MAKSHRPYVPRAIANGESDLQGVASVAISSTEGSVMMSKLYGAPTKFTGS